MTRRVRRHLVEGAALLIALLCGSSLRDGTPLHRVIVAAGPAWRADRDVVLPAGFAGTIDRATSDQLVRVVAGDVDRDGDIDVVASLGSLDLVVWKNDGAGHFTRQPASHRPTLQTQPAAPSVDGDAGASNEWIQNGGHRGMDLDSLRGRSSDDPDNPFSPIVGVVTSRYGPRARPSRAPPISSR